MVPRLSGQNWIFFKVSFVPKRLYQIDAYRAGYQTRDQEFWNEMPLMGACKSSVELQVNKIFGHFNFLIRFQCQSRIL